MSDDLELSGEAAPRLVVLAVSDAEVAQLVELSLPGEVALRRARPHEALDVAARWPGAIVVAMLADAAAVCSRASRPPTLFLTGGLSLEQEWSAMVRHQVRYALHPRLAEHSGLLRWVLGRMQGRRLDIGVVTGCASWRSAEVGGMGQRGAAVGEVLAELASHGRPADEIARHRLAVEEILNNALLHAFVGARAAAVSAADGGRPGIRGQVTVEHAVTADVFALRVEDSAGALTGSSVRASIRRQVAGEGLLDEGGRGLFLAFTLANVLAVERDPGRSTRVELVFFRRRPSEHKAFLITDWEDLGPDR